MNMEKYNIIWHEQSVNSGESMPCGGFDTGANVWVENNELLIYLDRSGSFDENNQMLKLGRIRLQFDQNPFSRKFEQELVLEKGYVRIKGDKTEIRVWFDVFKPVCHIDMTSEREYEVTAWYESWRTQERELLYGEIGNGERQAAASYVCYPGKVITYPDEIRHEKDSVIFYHRNRSDKLLFDFLVDQQNLSNIRERLWNPQKNLTFGGKLTGKNCRYIGERQGIYAEIPYVGFGLRSERGTEHAFQIYLCSGQKETVEEWEEDLAALCEQAGKDKSADSRTAAWWKEFWERSYIFINPVKGEEDTGFQIARNYTLFRYMLACNAYGKYPTKFNGGLFTTDACYSIGEGQTFSMEKNFYGKNPDFRMWGGGSFTAQNQRLVYWPMLKNGDFDMMRPQFDFYNRLLKNAELRTFEYWEHKGCSFTEQLENIGLPIGWTWGYEDSPWEAFRRPKNFDRTELICPSTRYEYSTQLEFAYMMIQYYRYTGYDISQYIPFIESCITFYFEHYEKIHMLTTTRPLDRNGKLVIFPSTALESYKDALNPADAVSGLKALLAELMELPEYVDAEYYKRQYEKVPDLKTCREDDVEIIMPAWSWTDIHNCELPQLYPVFPYQQLGIGRGNLDLAINTWKKASDSQKNYISWHQDGIFTARMGLREEAREINEKKLKNSGRRFPAFWGPGHDWVPDHNWGGSGMIGLQDMLIQQYGNDVYLLPAWPETWDVSFKLCLPGRAVMECTYRKGELTWEFVQGYAGQRVIWNGKVIS